MTDRTDSGQATPSAAPHPTMPEAEAVRRSVDAQFPVVAAFLGGEDTPMTRADRPLFVPPLDVAVNIAQQALTAAQQAQAGPELPGIVAAGHLGALTEALRSLLAAVTAELYSDPEEREERIPGQRPPSPHSATEATA